MVRDGVKITKTTSDTDELVHFLKYIFTNSHFAQCRQTRNKHTHIPPPCRYHQRMRLVPA